MESIQSTESSTETAVNGQNFGKCSAIAAAGIGVPINTTHNASSTSNWLSDDD